MRVGLCDNGGEFCNGDGFAIQVAFLDDCIFDSGMPSNNCSTLGEHIHDILGMFHIGLSCCKTTLRAVVETLQGLMNRVTSILLALEVEQNPLEDCQQFKPVTGACRLFIVLLASTFCLTTLLQCPHTGEYKVLIFSSRPKIRQTCSSTTVSQILICVCVGSSG
jgi:hypothetical protein